MPDNGATDAVLKALAERFKKKALADFVVVCGEQQWKVHGLVLALHSPVLARAVEGDFKEANDKKVDLSSHDAACIDCLMHYMYSLEYMQSFIAAQGGPKPLKFHVQMCVLADKYSISALKRNAESRFSSNIRNRSDIELGEAAAIAYDASPATGAIRTRLVAHAIEHEMLIPRTPGKRTALCEVMVNNSEFRADYAQALEERLAKFTDATTKVREGEERFKCAYGQTMVVGMREKSGALRYRCWSCFEPRTGTQWLDRVVKDE